MLLFYASDFSAKSETWAAMVLKTMGNGRLHPIFASRSLIAYSDPFC